MVAGVDTWKYLSELSICIKNKKKMLCDYLRGLETGIGEENFTGCVAFFRIILYILLQKSKSLI